ncbi:hypothetical protein, partial [Salinispora tropica]|uniref:hypothetical protein n=1 Tax=Salinispora tropica TaxID=168695 RepID=UPI0018AFF4B5
MLAEQGADTSAEAGVLSAVGVSKESEFAESDLLGALPFSVVASSLAAVPIWQVAVNAGESRVRQSSSGLTQKFTSSGISPEGKWFKAAMEPSVEVFEGGVSQDKRGGESLSVSLSYPDFVSYEGEPVRSAVKDPRIGSVPSVFPESFEGLRSLRSSVLTDDVPSAALQAFDSLLKQLAAKGGGFGLLTNGSMAESFLYDGISGARSGSLKLSLSFETVQRIGGGNVDLAREIEIAGTVGDGRSLTSRAGVGLSQSFFPEVGSSDRGPIRLRAGVTASLDGSRSWTAASSSETTLTSTVTYEGAGKTFLYKLEGKYQVEVSLPVGQADPVVVKNDAVVYVRVPERLASRFEATVVKPGGGGSDGGDSPSAQQQDSGRGSAGSTRVSGGDAIQDLPTGLFAVEYLSESVDGGQTVASVASALLQDRLTGSQEPSSEVRSKLGVQFGATRLVRDFHNLTDGQGITELVELGGRSFDVTVKAVVGRELKAEVHQDVKLDSWTNANYLVTSSLKQGAGRSLTVGATGLAQIQPEVTKMRAGGGVSLQAAWTRTHGSVATLGGDRKDLLAFSGEKVRVAEHSVEFDVSVSEARPGGFFREAERSVRGFLGLDRSASGTVTAAINSSGVVQFVTPNFTTGWAGPEGASAPTTSDSVIDAIAKKDDLFDPGPAAVNVLRLRGLEAINDAIERVVQDLPGEWSGLRLKSRELVSHFDAITNGGWRFGSPSVKHTFFVEDLDVIIEAQMYKPQRVDVADGLSLERRNAEKLGLERSTASGTRFGVNVELGVPLLSGKVGWTRETAASRTDKFGVKRTTGVTYESDYAYYRGDVVYTVSAYRRKVEGDFSKYFHHEENRDRSNWATVKVAVPGGVEFVAAKQVAERDGLDMGEGAGVDSPMSEGVVPALPQYVKDGFLGSAVVESVKGIDGADGLLPKLTASMRESYPALLPRFPSDSNADLERAAQRYVEKAFKLDELLSPVTSPGLLPKILNGGVSHFFGRSLGPHKMETIEVRVRGELQSGSASYLSSVSDAKLRLVNEGDVKASDGVAKASGMAGSLGAGYVYRDGGGDLTETDNSTGGGGPTFSYGSGSTHSAATVESSNFKIKDTAKATGVDRFNIPVKFTVETRRHVQYSLIIDQIGWRAGTDTDSGDRLASEFEVEGSVVLALPSEGTVPAEGATASPSGRAIDMAALRDMVQAAPGMITVEAMPDPNGGLAREFRTLLGETINPLGSSRSLADRIVGPVTHGRKVLSEFLSEGMRASHFHSLLTEGRDFKTELVHNENLTTKKFPIRLHISNLENIVHIGTVDRKGELEVRNDVVESVSDGRGQARTITPGLTGQVMTDDVRAILAPSVGATGKAAVAAGGSSGIEYSTITKRDSISHRYRVNVEYTLEAEQGRSNMFIERVGPKVTSTLTVDNGLYFLIADADAIKLNLPMPPTQIDTPDMNTLPSTNNSPSNSNQPATPSLPGATSAAAQPDLEKADGASEQGSVSGDDAVPDVRDRVAGHRGEANIALAGLTEADVVRGMADPEEAGHGAVHRAKSAVKDAAVDV